MQKLNKAFFEKDTLVVAKNLLWKVIKVWEKQGIIFEVEAYKWLCDEASHAYPKQTPRNTLMYESFGKVYVYLIYWMHYCLNFTSDKTKPWAVLIRWVIDLETWKTYDWPWKLTKFLAIDKNFNWLDLENNKLIEIFDKNIKLKNIKQTPRIWISKAKDKLWRFIWEYKTNEN